jgi:hypothetical protein
MPAQSTGLNCPVVFDGDAGDNGFGIDWFNGQWRGLRGGVAYYGSVPATAGVWTHLAVVINQGTNYLYVNGVAASVNLGICLPPTNAFWVAGFASNAVAANYFTNFNGAVDEVRVFSFAPGAFRINDLLFNPNIVFNANDSGFGSLRSVVAGAAPNAVVTFAASLSGQTITLTSGQIGLANNITIDGSSLASPVTLDGNQSGRIFYVTNGVTATNNSLIIIHGNVAGADGINGGNGSDGVGGGIYNAGTLTLNNCTVAANSSVGGLGGSTQINGANGGNATGGGIYNAGTLTLNNCTLSGNSIGGGGGSSGGTGFGGGIGGSGYGGGIYNIGTLALNSSTLAGNTAYGGAGGGGGSGFLGFGGGTTDSFAGNGGNGGNGLGGGVFNGGALALNNCTVATNKSVAGAGGTGGINNVFGQGSLPSAPDGTIGPGLGGGVFNTVTLNSTNSIVCGNSATTANPNIYGSISSQANNLVDASALLAPLGNYGGPTQTMPPLPGSSAIDAGSDSVTNFLATDQRGLPRKAGAHVDIGAVEGVYLAGWAGPSRLTGPKRLNSGAGAFQFNFTNYPDLNTTFTVWASTNLAIPFNLWSNLGMVTDSPPGSGQYQFTDPGATNSNQRFYRVRSP